MALTKDEPRDYQIGDYEDYPVEAGAVMYEGAAAQESGTGYAQPVSGANQFLGFVQRKVDNSGGLNGDKTVRVLTRGRIKLNVAGVVLTDNDRPDVYASDDGTFTKTVGTNCLIGKVSRFVANGVAIVEFNAYQ